MIKISLEVMLRAVALLLAAFLIYHLALKLLGGSLGIEGIMFSLLTILGTLTFNNSKGLGRLEGKFDQFEKSFRALAYDFKTLSAEVKAISAEVSTMSTGFKAMSEEFRGFRSEFKGHNHKGGKVVF
ncbi:hypothetical protein HYU15_00970 [Candidatus Woesearchaeota archaeon]|nr:hypothetical protein [Candidatus Woesearchaeota archaeon]